MLLLPLLPSLCEECRTHLCLPPLFKHTAQLAPQGEGQGGGARRCQPVLLICISLGRAKEVKGVWVCEGGCRHMDLGDHWPGLLGG